MSETKKYFYLKVKETFFDSDEMKILESQKNGILYQNLYLKLSLLSLKSEGALMFKESLPYDVAMLSSVLRVDIDTVKVGIEMFQRLHLVEILDNGTMFMSDLQSMIGRSSSEGERVKAYRERIKSHGKPDGITYEKRTNVQNCTPELELETELELKTEKDKRNRRSPMARPTIDQVVAYCKERGNSVDPQKWFDHYTSNGWKIGGRSAMVDWKAAVRTWESSEYRKPTSLPSSNKLSATYDPSKPGFSVEKL